MKHTVAETDVAIIGGGPAGLAAAIAARAEGLSVIVFEAGRPPIDKPCGEGLMPDGLKALEALGIRIGSEHGYAFRGIRFTNGRASTHANFPSGSAIGIRRTALHSLLRERAAAVGAELRWGTPVTGISERQVHAGSEDVRCRWIVGADGHSSKARRWAGLESFTRDARRFGFRAHYHLAPWSDYMELHWGSNCQIYVTPVAAQEVCVVVMSDNPKLRMTDALAALPDVRERLAGVEPSSLERGAVTSTRRLRAVHRGDLALIGDASGSVDAITGEGLCLSFRQAAALGRALSSGDMSQYATLHRDLARRPTFMADFMLILAGRPRLRETVIHALAGRPSVFETMLATHVGAVSLPVFLSSVVALGWQMLIA
jgi:flavin-dependent dehydrogenase